MLGVMRSVLVVVAVSFSAPALAQSEEPETESYGWTTAAVDGVGLGLASTAIVVGIPCMAAEQADNMSEPPPPWACKLALVSAIAAPATYLAGGPIVHVRRGSPWRSVGSLGARLALPALGYAAAKMIDPDRRVDGLFIGVGTALALDWLVLSRETVSRNARPFVAPTRAGAVAGLGGVF